MSKIFTNGSRMQNHDAKYRKKEEKDGKPKQTNKQTDKGKIMK